MKTSSRYFIENILSYGIIAGLLIIIVRAAVYLFEIEQTNFVFGTLNLVYNLFVLSICLYLGTVANRKKTATGNLTYGNGLISCIAIGLVAVIMTYFYDIIFHVFIAPDYLKNMLEPQLAAIANSSIPSMQKMELMYKLEKWTSPVYNTSINALMSFGMSVVISLIMAIFTVRNRPVIIENPEEI